MLPEIRKYYPSKYDYYIEPFLGGGAVFFDLQPKKAIVNDLNEELINVYRVIRDDVKGFIDYLKMFKNTKEEYYIIRNLDRSEYFHLMSNTYKAARTLYLNKTCFNGLYRVNSKGQFNVSYGKHTKEMIIEEDLYYEISDYLNNNDIIIESMDFRELFKKYIPQKDDFIYFDPPYYPLSKTSNFASYTAKKFTKQDHYDLKCLADKFNTKGVKVLISNSSANYIRELYKNWNIIEVYANRYINSKTDKRGKVLEFLIMPPNNQI